MPICLKKFILSFLSFLILFSFIAPNFLITKAQRPGDDEAFPTGDQDAQVQAPAEGSWYNQSFGQWYDKVENSPPNEIFGERYTAAQVQWVFYGILKLIFSVSGEKGEVALGCVIGSDVSSCADEIKAAIESLDEQSQSQSKPRSSLNGTFLSAFSTRPISGVGYIHQKISKFRLVPEANAQGFGFKAVDPVQKLWTAFRDLSFGLIVIVALIMAFMIMFRVKISPQVMISLQSAIPKIVGALIFVTFSYAIAGFMIDLMYVVMGLLAAFLSNSNISTLSAPDIFNTLNNGSIIGLSIKYLFYLPLGLFSFFIGTAPGIVGQVAGGILAFMLSVILIVIAMIVLFFAIIKIMWLLLKTYANIIIQIALGPLQILMGTITPFGGLGGWLKSLAANLAVFPVVGFMYVLSYFFLAQAFTAAIPPSFLSFMSFPFGIDINVLPEIQSSWIPPLTVGAGFAGLLWIGVSLVVMTLIPKTAEIIQSAIAGKPFAYGTAIGEAMGPAKTVGLYGAAEGLNVAQRVASGGTGITPGWVQASRSVLGLKP